jgi:hypothetical protein
MAYKRKIKLDLPVELRSIDFNSRKTDIVSINGATSSKLDIDFHDLPYDGLVAAARRFAYGRARHGRFNWTKGNKDFAEERLKHAVNHLMLFCEERQQDDLDAVLCNLMMIAWYRAHGLMSNNPKVDFMLQGKNVSNK